MKITTKQLVQTAILLALCIISQYFKNLSVYITGPVINCILIIATLGISLFSGLVLAIISPVTAFLLTGSPIMAAIPLMFPVVMAGNVILVLCVWYFQNQTKSVHRLPAGLIIGSVLKSVFLGIVVVLILLPLLGENIAARLPKPEALPKVLSAAKITFSVTQLVTALIGSLLAYLIWIPLKKSVQHNSTL